MKIIKICDVKNIYEARTLGEYGVEYVGLHLITDRDVSRADDIKLIINLYHQSFSNTRSIIVTKETKLQKLIDIVDEFESDGLQLHYQISPVTIARLRAHFGRHLIIFVVTTPEEKIDLQATNYADYIIIDKSYQGGTGSKIPAARIQELIGAYDPAKILLAGGIDEESILSLQERNTFAGFDIQSAVKVKTISKFENISLEKLLRILAVAKKSKASTSLGQIGFSVQEEDKVLNWFGACDFWHFDFFDNVFGQNTDIHRLIPNVSLLSEANSHLRFQIHIFSSRNEYIVKIINQLKNISSKCLEFYVHHNKHTIYSFELHDNIFASLDTKDIITGSFPLKKALSREKIVICLQSEKHIERSVTTNAAIRLIKELWGRRLDVTLDRGIFPDDLNYSLGQSVDIVSGRYLRDNKKKGYQELRRSLSNVR